MIEAGHLKKTYEGRTVLGDVSLRIGEGEIVGLYGPSGIGKSTVARILCGLVRPEAGEVFLDGQRLISAGSPYDRRLGRVVQMVFQQPHAALDPSQKIGAGLRELIRVHRLADSRRAAEELLSEQLERVGLSLPILSRRPHQISGGEAQRVCLARSLLLRPRLLILDEATSMLDVCTQANVLAPVRRETENLRGSVLFISHDRALTDRFCGRIYEMESEILKEVP